MYLQHHGILGQKWGKRNGPPYPLSDSSKSASEKKHYNVRAKDVKKNMDQMNDQELQRAINRINMQNTVSKMSPNIIDRGKNEIRRELKGFVGSVALISSTIAAYKKLEGWLN